MRRVGVLVLGERPVGVGRWSVDSRGKVSWSKMLALALGRIDPSRWGQGRGAYSTAFISSNGEGQLAMVVAWLRRGRLSRVSCRPRRWKCWPLPFLGRCCRRLPCWLRLLHRHRCGKNKSAPRWSDGDALCRRTRPSFEAREAKRRLQNGAHAIIGVVVGFAQRKEALVIHAV